MFLVLHVSGVLMDGEVGCHEVEVLGDVDVSLVHGGYRLAELAVTLFQGLHSLHQIRVLRLIYTQQFKFTCNWVKLA